MLPAVKDLVCGGDYSESWLSVKMSVLGDHSGEPSKGELMHWKQTTKFQFNLIMGSLNLITQWVELLENEWIVNTKRINAKFEAMEVTLEKNNVNMDTYFLTANSELVSDSVHQGRRDNCRVVEGVCSKTSEWWRCWQLKCRTEQLKILCWWGRGATQSWIMFLDAL